MTSRNTVLSLLALPLLLTGCQSINNSIDAVGGMFTRSNDDTPSLLDNSETGQNWYCYGEENRPDWACTEQPDPDRISAVSSVTIADVVEAPPAPEPARSEPAMPEPAMLEPAITTAPQSDGVGLAEASAPITSRRPEIVGVGATILQQPADSFAVQLLALQDEQRLLAFASQQGLASPLHARILSGGEPWYVLLLGMYPDRASAETAKRNWVSGRTLALDPWVRTLGPLQTDIQRGLTAQLGAR